MEQSIPRFNLNLQVTSNNIDNLELIDELNTNNDLTAEQIVTKYFNDLHDELSQRGDSTLPGLAKTILTEVSFAIMIVFKPSWSNINTCLQSL